MLSMKNHITFDVAARRVDEIGHANKCVAQIECDENSFMMCLPIDRKCEPNRKHFANKTIHMVVMLTDASFHQ